jgi:ketosteroid isomerase-like protein
VAPNTLTSAVDQFYAAFMAGNFDQLSRIVTDDFTVDLPKLEHVKLEAEYHGIDGFRKLMADRDREKIVYRTFKEHDRMVDGDRVAVFGRTSGTAGVRQQQFAHDWVHLFRFDGGKIRLLKEYLDASEVDAAMAPLSA